MSDFSRLYTRTTDVEFLGQSLTIHHLTAEQFSKFRELGSAKDSFASTHYLLKLAIPGLEPEKLPASTLVELLSEVMRVNQLSGGESEAKN